MAEAQARAHPGAPWAVRLYGAVPLAPAWTGALIAAAWLLAFVGYALAADLTALEVDAGVQIFFELVCAVMIGFLPTATVYGVRGTARDLRALGPALGLSAAQLEERVRELVRFDARPLVSAGIIGAAAAFCLGIASADSPSAWPEGRPALGSPMMNWVMARTGVLAWLLGQTAYVEVALARRFSRVGANLAQVDFFDLRPLAPFARRGLRSVTGFIAFTVLTSLLLLVPWAQGAAVAILVAIFGAALAALLAPVLGVHRRLVEAKQAELERVRAAIRAETHAADEVDSVLDRTRAFADATLSDLIAYEARIASASTWPFDPGTLFRFGLFVAVGVGSWLGSALVERALGSALD